MLFSAFCSQTGRLSSPIRSWCEVLAGPLFRCLSLAARLKRHGVLWLKGEDYLVFIEEHIGKMSLNSESVSIIFYIV